MPWTPPCEPSRVLVDFIPPSICPSWKNFCWYRGRRHTKTCDLVSTRVLGFTVSRVRFRAVLLCPSCGIFETAPGATLCDQCNFMDAHLAEMLGAPPIYVEERASPSSFWGTLMFTTVGGASIWLWYSLLTFACHCVGAMLGH